MADHHREATHPMARKEHRCIYCYGPIFVGERYTEQTGHYDGRAYRNRFHAECFDDCAEEARWSGGEFTPGCADWPERVREAYEARNKTPNVGGEARLAAHQPSQTTTATPQGVASTDQLGGRVRSEKD